MEFEEIRQNPNLSLVTSIWLLTPNYRIRSNGLHHQNLRLKIYRLVNMTEIGKVRPDHLKTLLPLEP